jgi:hypothetical protein
LNGYNKENPMNRIQSVSRLPLVIIAILTANGIYAERASAAPVVKLTGKGMIEPLTDEPSRFVLQGNASHLGKYTCYGEVEFSPGDETGTLEGEGVAVIRAANGDLIVGIVTWQVDAGGNGQIAFSWRDFVQFSNGDVVSSTGRFIESRPAGAVSRLRSITDGTSNIIAILIG